MSISCKKQTCILTMLVRYTKQRRYNPNTDLVVKFLPREFAVELASILLHVKPVEAEFAREIYGSIPSNTSEFLFTVEGRPVKAETMNTVLSETFAEFGLVIQMSEFRLGARGGVYGLGGF